MTQYERLIVSAYTGYLMTDFELFHKFVNEKLGRPVFVHEFGSDKFEKELREKVKPEFLSLCGD